MLLVEEEAILRRLQVARELQPFDIERCFVEIEQTLNNERVIVSESFDIASALPVTTIQNLARWIVQLCPHKICGTRCDLEITRLVQHLSSARVCGDHQAVPRGNDFVIQMWARTLCANHKQFLARLGERFGNLRFALFKMSSG